jgi:O-antigen/teichoic acid export membrane protein
MTLIIQLPSQIRSLVTPYWQTIARSGSLYLISANLFTQAIGFISSLFVVRFLKPEELGETRVIATYISYVQLLGTLGLTTSVLTFIPRSNDPAIRYRWMQMTLLMICISTIGFAMVAAWLSSCGWLMSNAYTAYWFRWSLLGCLASSASSTLVAFYQAERAIRKLAGIQSVLRFVVLLGIVGGAWMAGFIGYVVAGIVGTFLTFGGLLAVLPRSRSPARWGPFPVGYMHVAAFALLGSLLWTVGRTADVVILDQLTCDRVQFGCYALANTIGMIMSFISSTVQVVAIPFFSSHFQDVEWVMMNARKWQIVGAFLGTFGAAAVFCAATLLIKFIYGEAYARTTSFLIPVLIAQCLLATFHILAAALVGMNLVRVNTMVATIVMPLSVLTTLVMSREYSIWGAAWAQVISATIYACMQSIIGWRALSRKAGLQGNP